MVSEGRVGWQMEFTDLTGKHSRASKHIAQQCFDKVARSLLQWKYFRRIRK